MGARSSRESDDGSEDDETGLNPHHNPHPLVVPRRHSSDPIPPVPNAERVVLEPRRHQGERGEDILHVLEQLYRSGQLRVMPGRRGVIRHPSIGEGSQLPVVAPDTSIMDKSDFKRKVLMDSGDDFSYRANVPFGHVPLISLSEFRPLKHHERIKLGQQFIPNTPYRLFYSEEKLFCGLHSQDGNMFMTSGQDQTIRIYDTSRACTPRRPLKRIRRFDAREVGWSVLDVRPSADGRYLAYSSWSDSIHLATVFDDSTHVSLKINPDNHHCGIFALMFSHDDTEILAGGNHGNIYIRSLLSEKCQRIPAHLDDVNTVAFADQSSHTMYSGGDDGVIRVWDRRDLSEARPRSCAVFIGHKHGIVYLDPHADGRHLLSNSKDQTIKLWDIRVPSPSDGIEEAKRAVSENRWDYRYRMSSRICTRRLQADRSIMKYSGHMVQQTLIRARFSPYESTASRFIYCGDALGSIYVFDALSGQVAEQLKIHDDVVRDVSWHPTRPEIISSGFDNCLNLWTYSDRQTVPDYTCPSELPSGGSESDSDD